MTIVAILFVLFLAFSPSVLSRHTTFHMMRRRGLNYTEARAACRSNYTDLATVYTDVDNEVLKKMSASEGFTAWYIGLYRSRPSEKWSNGNEVRFSKLKGMCGEPDCCAAMKPGDGTWESLHCRQTRNFMCYEGGAHQGEISYHLISENLTWYEAQRYCRRNYMDLVSVADQQQNTDVQREGLKSSTAFWIGLLWDDWEWSDGGRSAYRDWAENNPHPQENCTGKLLQRNWFSSLCTRKYSSLCYQTTVHVSDVGMSWERALEYCNHGNRAGILHIDSAAEQEELEYELRRRHVPAGSLWVGQTHDSEGHWSGVRQTGPPLSHCPEDTHTMGAAPEYQLNTAELRVVCEVKSP